MATHPNSLEQVCDHTPQFRHKADSVHSNKAITLIEQLQVYAKTKNMNIKKLLI